MDPLEISDLTGDRRRAAAAYDAELPDDAGLVRVWKPRDPPALRGRLGDSDLAAWAEDGVLHVLWRGEADRVILGGGVQGPMWPAVGADGLWEASWRVRRLDEAVITVMVLPLRGTEAPSGRPVTEFMTWRGPCSPPVPAADGPLAGEVREHVVDSAALRGPRAVSVYVPPGGLRGAPLPGCVLADGQSAARFARVLEPAIASGAAPPVLLVGVHSGSGGEPGKLPDQRARRSPGCCRGLALTASRLIDTFSPTTTRIGRCTKAGHGASARGPAMRPCHGCCPRRLPTSPGAGLKRRGPRCIRTCRRYGRPRRVGAVPPPARFDGAYRPLGRHDEATCRYTRALQLFRQVGCRPGEVTVMPQTTPPNDPDSQRLSPTELTSCPTTCLVNELSPA